MRRTRYRLSSELFWATAGSSRTPERLRKVFVGNHVAAVSRSLRVQCRRVQRICEQVIVPEIFVAAEEQPEVVPFIFFNAHARHVVRIAAIAEVAERKRVEEHPWWSSERICSSKSNRRSPDPRFSKVLYVFMLPLMLLER